LSISGKQEMNSTLEAATYGTCSTETCPTDDTKTSGALKVPNTVQSSARSTSNGAACRPPPTPPWADATRGRWVHSCRFEGRIGWARGEPIQVEDARSQGLLERSLHPAARERIAWRESRTAMECSVWFSTRAHEISSLAASCRQPARHGTHVPPPRTRRSMASQEVSNIDSGSNGPSAAQVFPASPRAWQSSKSHSAREWRPAPLLNSCQRRSHDTPAQTSQASASRSQISLQPTSPRETYAEPPAQISIWDHVRSATVRRPESGSFSSRDLRVQNLSHFPHRVHPTDWQSSSPRFRRINIVHPSEPSRRAWFQTPRSSLAVDERLSSPSPS